MKPAVALTVAAALLGSAVSQHGEHGEGVLSCDTSNFGLLDALLDADPVGVVHPEGDHGHDHEGEHDHDEGEHDHGDHDHDEGRRLQHDHDHDDEHDHGDEEHDTSNYPEVEFLGCNHTHFDVIYNNHIFTFLNEVYEFESDCEFVNHTEPETDFLSSFARHEEGNCYFVRCIAAGDGHDHGDGDHDHDHGDEDHDHGGGRLLFPRALQHDHDHDDHDHEGLDVDANSAYYLEDHVLYTAHAPLCCFQVTSETEPHHTCDFAEFVAELAEDNTPTPEPADPTIAIAIGAVTAFALLLVVVAWFSPSEKKKEEPAEEKVAELEVKAPIEVAAPVVETDAEAAPAEEVKQSV